MPLSVEEIQRRIIAEARRQGVDPALALGLAQAESSFNPNAVGDNGKSIGLFQLQPAAAHDVGMRPEERYDVDKNIAGGLKYLRNRLRREGDEDRGISAYNQGTGMRGGQLSNPQYVRTVRQYQRELQPVVANASTSLLSRVRGAVTPARAEAAETDGLAPGQARPDAGDPRDALGERLFGPKPTRQAASPAQSPAEGAAEATTGDPRDALGVRLFGPKPTSPAAETFPPLAEQEAAATQQALYGQAPGQPPALETPEATMRRIPAPQEPQGPPAPRQLSVPAPPTTPPASQAPSLLSRIGQAAETASRGTLGGQIYPLVQPILQAQYGEHLEKLPQAGGAEVISATGAMLGTAAGNYVVPGAGGLLGEMAGSYLARQLNVGLGLEEPGLLGDVASVAVPPVVRGATRVLGPLVTRGAKAVTRRLPGASTAMHEDIAERLATTEGQLRPARPVADYYADAARFNPAIAPNRLHTTASEILRQELRLRPSVRNPELVRIAEDLRDLSAQGTVPMQDLYAHQQRIGEIVRSWRNRGDTGERDIRRLYAAFHDDLERAANRGVPGAQELRAAIGASRAEHAADDFGELFRPGSGGVTVDPQGRIQFHGGKLRTRWNNRLHDDPMFAGGMTQQVRNEVDDIIMQAQRLERLRPPRGAQYGSGRRLTSVVLGGAVAGPIGSAILLEAPNLIAQAMGTQRGRAAVRWALQQGGGRINADDLAIIAALVRPTVQEAVAPPASETGGGPVGP